MKRFTFLSFLFVCLVATHANAQDFSGKWKVPVSSMLSPAKCKSGNIKACLAIAYTAQAGIRSAGQDDLKRLREASKYFALACKHAKKSTCELEAKVQKLIVQAQALKGKEQQAFFCVQQAKHFQDFASRRTAQAVVGHACGSLFPNSFREALDATAMATGKMRVEMMHVGAKSSLCRDKKLKAT